MGITVLGSGCSKCRLTVEMIDRVAKALSVNIQITEIEDPDEIKYLGLKASPAVMIDDQIVRLVQTHDADGGASLLRSLGHDLKQLAEHHACDHVLVASDDERFLSAIDEAQLSGLSVHLLADESARNMPQMVRSDPGWARLLSQADRRVIVNSQTLADMLQGKTPTGMGLSVEDVQELRQSMQEVVSAWWEEEPEDLREDLREALQVSRGIPQEVDRQLLLRMRQRLARALSLPEKKMLRETLRQVVTGVSAAEVNLATETAQVSLADGAAPLRQRSA